MFKKYYIDKNSEFNKSLILFLIEPGERGFKISGLSETEYKDLFSTRNIRFINNEVDFKSITTKVEVIYLDDSLHLKALVLSSSSGLFYLFKIDHQDEHKLNINQKYISNHLDDLLLDFESHSKSKGKINYFGEGDSSLIENINYFENLYSNDIKNNIDLESDIYQLLFESNNLFTTDFVYLCNNHSIRVVNNNELSNKVLTLEMMRKNNSHRKDCLFINSANKDIEYFIFTYKEYFINHYYLFKNLGNDEFLFIKEDISFNRLLASSELKDIKYKKASNLASKEFAKKKYDNFYNEYTSFEAEEEFETDIIKEFNILEFGKIKAKAKLLEFINEFKSIYKSKHYKSDIGVTFHGHTRILERIGQLEDSEMLILAKVAYEEGKNSVNYLESDPKMFKFLQYQQNKKRGKTLRLYKDYLFFYSMEPPHDLVTCFPFNSSFETYSKNN